MNDPVDLGDLTWSGILGTLWGATGAFRCSSGIYEGERREGVGSSHRGMVTFSLGTVSIRDWESPRPSYGLRRVLGHQTGSGVGTGVRRRTKGRAARDRGSGFGRRKKDVRQSVRRSTDCPYTYQTVDRGLGRSPTLGALQSDRRKVGVETDGPGMTTTNEESSSRGRTLTGTARRPYGIYKDLNPALQRPDRRSQTGCNGGKKRFCLRRPRVLGERKDVCLFRGRGRLEGVVLQVNDPLLETP